MTDATKAEMQVQLHRMQAAHIQSGSPSAQTRTEWIDSALQLLVENNDALCDALSLDFGHRSKDQSIFTDIVSSISALKHAKKHMKHWMRPQKRKSEFPLGLLGAKSEIRYQPKGVVGVVAPWNFPINLIFTPLAGIFSAGNRAMIKPSEFTPVTSDLVKELVAKSVSYTHLTLPTTPYV